MACRSELRGLGAADDELRRKNGRLWAISSDGAEDLRQMAAATDLRCSFLSDPALAAARLFDLVHEDGGPHGTPTAVPAHVLVGKDGRILWRRRATSIQDRPDPDEVLEAVRKVPGS